MPRTAHKSTLYTLTHLILTLTLESKYFYLDFINKDTDCNILLAIKSSFGKMSIQVLCPFLN